MGDPEKFDRGGRTRPVVSRAGCPKAATSFRHTGVDVTAPESEARSSMTSRLAGHGVGQTCAIELGIQLQLTHFSGNTIFVKAVECMPGSAALPPPNAMQSGNARQVIRLHADAELPARVDLQLYIEPI